MPLDMPGKLDRPMRASQALQDSHDAYRRALTSAIGRNFEAVAGSCPEVAEAMLAYAAFLARNPSVTFRLVNLDDLELTVEAGDRMFVR